MLFDAHVHLGWFSDPASVARDAAARGLGMLAVTVTPDEYLGARKALPAEKNVALVPPVCQVCHAPAEKCDPLPHFCYGEVCKSRAGAR